MVPRPLGLTSRFVEITFNNRVFNFLEIDLEHINKGKSQNRKTDLAVSEVVLIVQFFINDAELEANDVKYFGGYNCQFFVKKRSFRDKMFKLVFCICNDRPDTLGIITLHRI